MTAATMAKKRCDACRLVEHVAGPLEQHLALSWAWVVMALMSLEDLEP